MHRPEKISMKPMLAKEFKYQQKSVTGIYKSDGQLDCDLLTNFSQIFNTQYNQHKTSCFKLITNHHIYLMY